MKDYVIYTDSCADLSPEMLTELDVKVQNMHFRLNYQEYLCTLDEEQLRFREFYEQLRQGGIASSGQVSLAEYMDTFSPLLAEGTVNKTGEHMNPKNSKMVPKGFFLRDTDCTVSQ